MALNPNDRRLILPRLISFIPAHLTTALIKILRSHGFIKKQGRIHSAVSRVLMGRLSDANQTTFQKVMADTRPRERLTDILTYIVTCNALIIKMLILT